MTSLLIGYNLIKVTAIYVVAIATERYCAAPKLCFLLESPVARFANHPLANMAASEPGSDLESEPSVVFGESFEAFLL